MSRFDDVGAPGQLGRAVSGQQRECGQAVFRHAERQQVSAAGADIKRSIAGAY